VAQPQGVLPGARPAPHRLASRAPWARLGSPDPSPQSPRRSTCARAGRARRYVRRRSAVTTSGGDVCSSPGHYRTGGGDVVLSWQATCWLGADGGQRGRGHGPTLSPPRMCWWCNTPIPIVIIPAGINRCRRIKLLRRFSGSNLSHKIAVAPSGMSHLDIFRSI
jgi:hypothetical protein